MKYFKHVWLGLALGLAAHTFADESSFQQQSGCSKQDYIWQKIENSQYEAYPKWTGREALPLVGMALPWNREATRRYMEVSVDRQSDFMPEGRQKIVHTYGSVAKFEFIPAEDTPYTGLFTGVQCGLIRLSLAVRPNVIVMPGAALKFFIDGIASRNIQLLYKFGGQPTYNFFANELTNRLQSLPPPLSTPLKATFGTVTRDPLKVSLRPMSLVNQEGFMVSSIVAKFPKTLVFVPNKSLKFSAMPHEIRSDIDQIPSGTVLYEVYAADSNQREYLGVVRTTSPFISSSFGDNNLFFNHQRVELDE